MRDPRGVSKARPRVRAAQKGNPYAERLYACWLDTAEARRGVQKQARSFAERILYARISARRAAHAADQAEKSRVSRRLRGFRKNVRSAVLQRNRPDADCGAHLLPLFRNDVRRRRSGRGHNSGRCADVVFKEAVARQGAYDRRRVVDDLRLLLRLDIRYRGHNPRL